MELVKLTVIVLVVALMLHVHVTESRKENNKKHPNGHKPWKSTNSNNPSMSYSKDIDGKSSKEWKSKESKKSSKPVCTKLPVDPNGHFELDCYGDSTIGSTASLSCCNGYGAYNNTIACQSGGEWGTTIPVCAPNECGPVPRINDGSFKPDFSQGEFGDIAVQMCDVNFTLATSKPSFIVCQANSTWSETGECARICTKLPVDPNGHFELDVYSDSTIGSTATLLCSHGYSANNNTLTCQADGEWGTTIPVCAPNECGPVPGIVDGSFKPDFSQGEFGDIAVQMCDVNFILATSKPSFIVCQAKSTWSEPGECTRICTKLPVDPNGHFELDVYGDSTIGSTATLLCSHGYSADNNTITCQADGEWGTTIPVCAPNECRALPEVTDGEYTTTSFLPGSTAELTCVTDYKVINGPATITCQADQTWTSTTSCCFGLVDLVFVLDGSCHVQPAKFELLKTFLKGLVTLVETPNTQFGLLRFNHKQPAVQFHLNAYNNMPDKVNADIADTSWPCSGPYTNEALDMVRTRMLTTANGLRANATQIVLVTIGDKSPEVEKSIAAAAALKGLGVKIMVLGVKLDDTAEIKAIASEPQFALQANFSTESLAAVQTQVQAVLCNLIQPGG